MSSTRGKAARKGGPDDFFPTPRWAVRRLLERYQPRGGLWLEPSAGDGAIIRAAREMRSDVQFMAIEKREEERAKLEACALSVNIYDFLRISTHGGCPFSEVSLVIGNDPYSLAMQFILQSRALCPQAEQCKLLRLNFMGTDRRAPWLKTNVPDLYILPNRPSFTMDDDEEDESRTDSCEYAWFVWFPWPRTEGKVMLLDQTPLEERKRDRGRIIRNNPQRSLFA